jgi:hypothetical protein
MAWHEDTVCASFGEATLQHKGGAAGRDRTCHALLFRQALYRLSYRGMDGDALWGDRTDSNRRCEDHNLEPWATRRRSHQSARVLNGALEGDRTPGFPLDRRALWPLSYEGLLNWSPQVGSNHRPRAPKARALPTAPYGEDWWMWMDSNHRARRTWVTARCNQPLCHTSEFVPRVTTPGPAACLPALRARYPSRRSQSHGLHRATAELSQGRLPVV